MMAWTTRFLSPLSAASTERSCQAMQLLGKRDDAFGEIAHAERSDAAAIDDRRHLDDGVRRKVRDRAVIGGLT